MASEEEMASLEQKSNHYIPDMREGPLISDLEPTQAIAEEYAQADPVYVRKTEALSRTFPKYRTIKGDGNCGWRALAFGYFEALLHYGTRTSIDLEKTRLKTFNDLLTSLGYDEYLYSEFVQQTLDLLDNVAVNLPCRDGGKELLSQFNDDTVSSSIIAHFRLITSVWMSANADMYSAFLLDGTIDQYRATYIDPFSVEIEHLGMNACFDAILKPAGIAVDISYLDRTEGDKVNTFTWPAGSPDAPTLRMLYRPGHYDVLYTKEDLDKIDSNSLVSVYAMHTPISHPMYHPTPYLPYLADFDALSLIPGASMHPVSPVYPPYQSSDTGFDYLPPGRSSHGDMFRKSILELDLPHNQPCQTSAMKRAGEDRAHFKNIDFQPEVWSPP